MLEVKNMRHGICTYHLWVKEYFVSTAGKDEKAIREYIKRQEVYDRRTYQMNLFLEDEE